MTNSFLATLDGSGKTPRAEQLSYLQHLDNTWGKFRVFGLMAPPGVGKSFIARTIQRTIPNTAILTINNALVDQYIASYPELNGLKGKDYYPEESAYRLAKKRARTHPTVFNPLSYYYFYMRNPDLTRPTTVVIDEAHKIDDLLLLTIAKSYDCEQYGIPKGLSDAQFLQWLTAICAKLAPVHAMPETTASRKRLANMFETLEIVRAYLQEHLSTVRVFYEMKEDYKKRRRLHLTIQPLKLPVGLLDTIFGSKTRIVLMSGTLVEPHLMRFFPNESSTNIVQFAPVAPRESRLVYFTPVAGDSRWDPRAIANAIRREYLSRGAPNTLIHLSYSFSKQLAPLLANLQPIVVTSKDDKAEKLEQFKVKGGILLGAGMAEGVDLPGDLCRLIIIPRLNYPNRGDTSVMKQLAFPDGEMWYGLNTLLTTVQQLGRGVRGADDWCNAVIMDPQWPRLVQQYGKWLPKGFHDGLVWDLKSA